jgi:TIR domain-containing protein
VGEVSLAIRVDTQQARAFGDAPAALDNPVACYRKIFASYSHTDEAIVEQFEQLVGAFGDKYLRDVRDIRAGEKWDERLEELIREADIFQLFWSKNSMRSKFVRDEWEYALALEKHNFIRPTFWEVPMPEDRALGLPPEALLRLQFKRVPVYGEQPRISQNMKEELASLRRELELERDMRVFFDLGPAASRAKPYLAKKGFPRWTLPIFALVVFLALGAIGFLIWYLIK